MKNALLANTPGVIGLIVLALLWHISSLLLEQRTAIANLLTPAAALESLYRLLIDGQLWPHIGSSLRRVFVGLIAALLIGVPLGFLLGISQRAERSCTPAFQFLRMISPLSWMPIIIMLLGIGDVPIYFLLAFAALWPIMLNTANGVRSINPQWLELGRSLSATRTEMLFKIILPAVLGDILTGLRLAIGMVWILPAPCEMLGVNEGLGYFILDTRDRLAYSELMAAIVLIGLIGWALDSSSRRLGQWRRHA